MTKVITPSAVLGEPPTPRKPGTPCVIDRIESAHDHDTATYVHSQMLEKNPAGVYVWTAPDLAKRITERLNVDCGTQSIRKHRIDECSACRTARG